MTTENSQRLPERTPIETMLISRVKIYPADGSPLISLLVKHDASKGFYRVVEKIVNGVKIIEHEVNISYVFESNDT
jgi:hypothetical protein